MIAIKQQIRKLMADDQVKKAEAQARAASTDIPPMNVGPKRRTAQLQSIWCLAGPVDYDLAVRGNNHVMILR
jgi:hypothetical protein